VLLIEQHRLVGGCATQFKRKGYRFEVSLHELNGLDINEHLYKMYKDLNPFENLKFLKIPEIYRWIRSDMDIIVADDADQA
jgi:phytoene dehydrogenase-like protein